MRPICWNDRLGGERGRRRQRDVEVQGDPEKFLRLFAMIQKSDYIQITGIRQKDLPPDP